MMISSKSSIDEAGDIIIQTTSNIEEVYEASTKIRNITKIIEDIAFQTNILALMLQLKLQELEIREEVLQW